MGSHNKSEKKVKVIRVLLLRSAGGGQVASSLTYFVRRWPLWWIVDVLWRNVDRLGQLVKHGLELRAIVSVQCDCVQVGAGELRQVGLRLLDMLTG